MQPDTDPSVGTPRRHQLRVTLFFVLVATLLASWIHGMVIWHGSDSPFNTSSGKAAFIGIFVGGPVYIYARLSKKAGFISLAISLCLWTFGTGILVAFIELLSLF